MELFEAHTQWATRPSDERFQSVEALRSAVHARGVRSSVKEHSATGFSHVGVQELCGMIAVGGHAVTNWSLGQLAGLTGVPAGYLRSLPTELAVQNLRHAIKHRLEERATDLALLIGDNNEGDRHFTVLRACNSSRYTRVWDYEVLDQVAAHAGDFKPPLGYKDGEWGAPMVPSGLYASDHDVFCFLVNEENPLVVGNDVLHRGFYCWNSEVGGSTFGWSTFWYRRVCGNNIIWGANHVHEVRIRHVGTQPRTALTEWFPAALDALRTLPPDPREEYAIVAAKGDELATDAESAVTALRERGFSGREAVAGVAAAEREEELPFTRWGLLQGVTAFARTIPETDTRVELERRAPALLMPALN